MNHAARILFGLLCLMWTACSRQSLTDKPVTLRFSTDTIRFDTVFTARGTATIRLMVHNPASQAVRTLVNRTKDSPFSLNVDGIPLDGSCEAEIAADDSMYIFVEAAIGTQNSNLPIHFLDSLAFNTNGNLQHVWLEAYGQDITLIRNVSLPSSVWEGTKPYLIEGLVVLDTLQRLQIREGVKVYLGSDANLLIKGTVIAEGTVEKPILFAGARLEDDYIRRPGQWGSLQFQTASRDNLLSHVELRGGTNGLLFGQTGSKAHPAVKLDAVTLHYMSYDGLRACSTDVEAVNCLMTDCVNNVVALYGGGSASFTHCTLANGYSDNVTRRAAPILAIHPDEQTAEPAIPAVINVCNSLICGTQNQELETSDKAQMSFSNCIITTQLPETSDFFHKVAVNRSPRFVEPENGDYSLATNSPARDSGNPDCATTAPLDMKGRDRMKDGKPDMGAIEGGEEEIKIILLPF